MLGRLGWLTLWAAACSGPTDDKDTDVVDDDGDDDDDDDDDDTGPTTESTPEGPEYFEAEFFIVEAEFGWDSTTQQLVTVTTPYGEYAPIIIAMYGSPAWEAEQFSYDSDNYCVVQIPLTISTLSPRFQGDPSAWFGWDADPEAGLATNCNLGDGVFDFDPALWGEDPIGELLAWEWGAGVGEIVPAVYDQWADSEFAPNVVGGIILNNSLPYGHNEYVALNREIDSSYNVILDEELRYTFLPAESIDIGGNIATGWYTIVGGGIWSFE